MKLYIEYDKENKNGCTVEIYTKALGAWELIDPDTGCAEGAEEIRKWVESDETEAR